MTIDIRGPQAAVRTARSGALGPAPRSLRPLQPMAQPLQPAQPIQQVQSVQAMQPVQPIRPMQPVQSVPVQPMAAQMQPLPVRNPVQPVRQSPFSQQPTAPAVPALPNKRLPISMEVPGEPSPGKAATVNVIKSKWKAARRWVFRSTAVVMVLIIASGGLIFSQGWFKAKKVFKGGTSSAAALKENVSPTLLKGEGDGRINVLLLGRGGGNHDAPDLTDTMMVASIDPVNKTATLLSVPRDLWVSVEGAGPMKVNAAFASGKYKHLGKITGDNTNPKATLAGFATVDQVVENVIGVPIHYNILVDFEAFKKAIDTVGGITVNVPADLVDPTMAWENKRDPVIAKAGVQKFDGKKALMYSRSRATSSDFARGERQRAVLLGLKDQVNTLGTLSNPAKLSGLANAFGSNIQTDMSLNDAARFAGIVKGVDNSTINSIGLADEGKSFVTTANVAGQSVVQPKAGQFIFSAIQNFVRSQLKDPYLAKEQAKIQVYNGTTVEGLAGSQAEVLKSYGYTVTGTGNTPSKGYAETVIIDMTAGKSKYTKQYLEQRYGVTAVTTMPDAAILPNGADFVIIVGNDTTSLNQG